MKISVFDIDGTLAKGFFIIEFPEMLCERHVFVPAENDDIKNIYRRYASGESYEGKPYEYEQFAWDAINAFGRGIKKQSRKQIMKLGREYVAQNPNAGFPFAKNLVGLVKSKGYRAIAVSGSPYEVVLPFAESLGIEETYATTYKHENGVFTGEVMQNCAIDTEKKSIIDWYFAEHNVDVSASTGFGDSHHDLSFLERVGYAVAMKPNSKLEEVANREMGQKIKRWLICKDDDKVLDSVRLYLP